jgi:hypothetical protein
MGAWIVLSAVFGVFPSLRGFEADEERPALALSKLSGAWSAPEVAKLGASGGSRAFCNCLAFRSKRIAPNGYSQLDRGYYEV